MCTAMDGCTILNGLSTTTHRHRDVYEVVVPPSITNNAPEIKTIGISAY